jgi:excisionase family DNA binding protein
MSTPTDGYITTGAAARRLQVSRQTVTYWCAAGFIPGAWKTPGKRGSWRVPGSAIESLLRAWPPKTLPYPGDYAAPEPRE